MDKYTQEYYLNTEYTILNYGVLPSSRKIKICCIYTMNYQDKVLYVGSTTNFRDRIQSWASTIRTGKANPILTSFFDCYGSNNIKLKIVELVEKHELISKECEWYDLHKPSGNLERPAPYIYSPYRLEKEGKIYLVSSIRDFIRSEKIGGDSKSRCIRAEKVLNNNEDVLGYFGRPATNVEENIAILNDGVFMCDSE